MMIKTALLVSCLAATPVVVVSSTQDPGATTRGTQSAEAGATTQDPVESRRPGHRNSSRISDLEAQVERLRAEVEAQRERAEVAEGQVDRVLEELREALDMLLAAPPRERSCAPSRELLDQHEWLKKRGHDQHAEKAIDRISKQYRNDTGRINRLAWTLLTDDECAGKYDQTAFALAEKMRASSRKLPHQYLDTIALAHFINGRIENAVTLQQKALTARGGDNSDYRRRLRTYQSALLALRAEQAQVAQYAAMAEAAAAANAGEIAEAASEEATEAANAEVAEAANTEVAGGDGGDDGEDD